MGRPLSEKKGSKEIIKEKDAEIEALKIAQQGYIIRIKELEAEVASLQDSTDSEEEELPMSIFRLPELPLSLRERKQPISVLANLPALPVFTGFDTSEAGTALRTPLSIPEASPEGLLPRSTALFSSTKSTLGSTKPPNFPTPRERRPKSAVSPPLPHHQSFRAVTGPPPPATASTLPRDSKTPSLSLRNSSKPASLSLSALKSVSFTTMAHYFRAFLYTLYYRLCLHRL